MEILERILIISHVVAGATSLLTGLLAAFVGRKGGKWHKRIGKVFHGSMLWIFLSAILIVSFVRFNFFLLIIAVFSYYMAFSGVRALKIKSKEQVSLLDWVAGYLTLAFGLSLIGFGLYWIITTGNFGALELLSVFFGFFTAQTAYENLRIYMKLQTQDKMWWWLAHMSSMSGSLIACITAFLVQNGRMFDLPSSMGWVLWLLPALAGVPITSYWARKYRKQFKMGKYASA